MSVGLLRFVAHLDLALEDAVRAVVDDALENLARLAPGRRMVDERRERRLLAAAQEIGAIDGAMRALAGDCDLRVL